MAKPLDLVGDYEPSDLNDLFTRMIALYEDKHSIKRFRTQEKLILEQRINFQQDYDNYIKGKDFSKLSQDFKTKLLFRMQKFNGEIDIRIKELINLKFKLK